MRTWMSAGIQAVCSLGDEAIPGRASLRSITLERAAVLVCREHTFTNHGSQKSAATKYVYIHTSVPRLVFFGGEPWGARVGG